MLTVLPDLSQFDTAALLKPFLAVIRSSSTTGAITSLALNSISKFFSYRLINSESPNLAEAMRTLSGAVTHCRFEALDNGQQDDVVLLRILMLIQEMLCGVGGELLSDESVCKMVEVVLSMCCQTKRSEMLRRNAEMCMIRMTQVVFMRLRQLDKTEIEDGSNLPAVHHSPVESPRLGSAHASTDSEAQIVSHDEISASGEKAREESLSMESSRESIEPYGLAAIKELLRVLIIDMLKPTQRDHRDSPILIALRIIDVAFEVGGQAIADRLSLRKLATDDLCRQLFQLIRSDSHIVLQTSLRVISTLLHTMRVHLKLQQELFLNYVVACLVPKLEALREAGIDPSSYETLPVAPRVMYLTSGRSTPTPSKEKQKSGSESGARGAEAREVLIECIGSLVRIPTFMVDLFVNYDCDETLSDLYEDVLGFLCRNAFPDAANWSTSNVPPLCLDALLGHVSLVASRLDLSTEKGSTSMPDLARLLVSRKQKELAVVSAARFNENPKSGVQFLKDNGVVSTDNETESLAKFLFTSDRIDKRLLGDYISKASNRPLLQAFLKCFDFQHKSIIDALRDLLQKFRLAGEGQQIDRVVQEFANLYVASGQTEAQNADAAHILAFAIIMLNTDLHNPNVKAKMTFSSFSSILRGQNNKENFRPEYLQANYNEIMNNEIIMVEEHDTSASFEYVWSSLQRRAATVRPFVNCETNLYDEAMFRASWKPLVTTLSFVLQSATDDTVFSRVSGGLIQCASIAARYGITEVMDQIILSLAKMTLLANEQIPGIEGNIMVEVDAQKVTVSELGVAFGREIKAQLAVAILVRICKGNEKVIRAGWSNIFDIFSALLVNSLLPENFSPLQRYMNISPIPLPPPNRSSKVIQRNQESSFFSSLSSYLSSYATDDLPQPTSEEIDSTMCTFDLINSCHLDTVASNVLLLDIEEAEYLVNYLIEDATVDSAAKRAVLALLSTPQAKGQPLAVYDPAELLKLEVATAIALKNVEHTKRFGGRIMSRLQDILKRGSQNHALMSERAIAYSLRLYQAAVEVDLDAESDLIMQYAALDVNVLKNASVSIAFGLLGVLRVDSAVAKIAQKTEIYDLLRKIQPQPDAASLLFEIVALLSSEAGTESFMFLVEMLNDFAAAGQVGAYDERQALIAKRRSQDKRASRQQDTKPVANHRDEIARACRAIELLYQLRLACTEIAKQSDSPTQFWSPLICKLRDQCLNPCKEVGKCAFTHLQRLLLSLDLSTDNPAPSVVFDDAIIPLLDTLQDPKAKMKANEDNKVQASSLLCKVWLHHLASIQSRDDATSQWLRVLSALLQLMTSAQSAYLTEAITESIKNVLLVMGSTGMIVKGNPTARETSRILKEVNLDLMEDLFGKEEDDEPVVGEDSVQVNPSGDVSPAMSKQEDAKSEEIPEEKSTA